MTFNYTTWIIWTLLRCSGVGRREEIACWSVGHIW